MSNLSAVDNISPELKDKLLKERNASIKRIESYIFHKKSSRIDIITRVIPQIMLLFYLLYAIICGDISMSKMENIPIINVQIPHGIMIFVLMSFAVFLGVMGTYIQWRHIQKLVKKVCFSTAVSAAESLEKNNLGNAAFYSKILFSNIKTFTDAEKIKIGPWKSSLTPLYLGNIEKIQQQQNALAKRIMTDVDTSKIINHFYILANYLFNSHNELQYNKTIESIHFLVSLSEKNPEPLTFLYKHPKIDKTLKIVIEFLKLTIPIFVGAILFYFLGYEG